MKPTEEQILHLIDLLEINIKENLIEVLESEVQE